jgi:uncharacterized protein YkwD
MTTYSRADLRAVQSAARLRKWQARQARSARQTCDDDLRPQWVAEIFSAVNQLRGAYGLALLQLDDDLTRSAQAKADDMVARNYYGHVDPDGNEAPCGENIAMHYPDAAAVFEGWLTSSGHRDNMTHPRYRRIGIGVKERRWVMHLA